MALKIGIAGGNFLDIDKYLREKIPEAEIVRIGEEELHGRVDIDIVIPCMCRIESNLLTASPRLRLVQQWGSGLEAVDKKTATKLGIAVANVPTEGTGNAESVAEWCVMAAIAISRGVPLICKQVKQGSPWGSPCGQTLLGKTAGIVGLGGIGKEVASRLKVFKMRMVGVKRSPAGFDTERFGMDWVAGMDALPDLLSVSDYVFLCLPLVQETRELIGSRELAMIPKGSYLINAARGGLINREALFEAINNRHLAGIALDVFWQEPASPGDYDLAGPQVLATPHVAGVTDLSYQSIAERVAENINRVMNGMLPLNCVNQEIKSMPYWRK